VSRRDQVHRRNQNPRFLTVEEGTTLPVVVEKEQYNGGHIREGRTSMSVVRDGEKETHSLTHRQRLKREGSVALGLKEGQHKSDRSTGVSTMYEKRENPTDL